ncbi:hypothetical protein [Paraburkholderia azotifigens]|uniref:Uncharacterized protein n=1 Tax=Paraburkholderia azotifigens TaxID=2057004 RepID=A0ABU9QZK7_9BURK
MGTSFPMRSPDGRIPLPGGYAAKHIRVATWAFLEVIADRSRIYTNMRKQRGIILSFVYGEYAGHAARNPKSLRL